MTPLDIRPLPAVEHREFAGAEQSSAEACGFVDDEVIARHLAGVPLVMPPVEFDGRAWADPPFALVLAR